MNQSPVTPDPKSSPEAPIPVAYDSQGRPLYAAPPQSAQEPRVVHLSRAVAPDQPEVTPEIKTKHEESARRYPSLNLSESEFVISAVRRHPIGLFLPITLTAIMVILVISLMISFDAVVLALGLTPPPFAPVLLLGTLLTMLLLVGGYIVVWVYLNNRFFLTNESVIQEIQLSLFSKHEQTVSLANIEDASYRQHGIIQTIFDYGSIRLSTEGDETTYRFNYVAHPKRQIAILNNAVEAFKNGRPVSDSDN